MGIARESVKEDVAAGVPPAVWSLAIFLDSLDPIGHGLSRRE